MVHGPEPNPKPNKGSASPAYTLKRLIWTRVTTHQQLAEDDLAACGVTPDMVRLSVGLEDIEDLIWDLDNALEASQQAGDSGDEGSSEGSG